MSELTIFNSANEYWGLVASCFNAFSAVHDLFIRIWPWRGSDGCTRLGAFTFAMLGRVQRGIKQPRDLTNVGRHRETV